MYSSQRPLGVGLTRYGSAPSSLLKNLLDSAIDDDEFSAVGSSQNLMSKFFSADSSSLTSESSYKPSSVSPDIDDLKSATTGLERSSSFAMNEISAGNFATVCNLKSGTSPAPPPALIRHSSSPAGFLSHLMVDNNAGFSVTRGQGNYSYQAGGSGVHGIANTRLKSQLSFSRQDSLSQLSDISIPEIGESGGGQNGSDDSGSNLGQAYMSGNFTMGSWDETNSIAFSAPPSKRAKDINGDIVAALSSMDSEFGLPRTSLEMASMEKLIQMQHDNVACKTRAKRGCATHPRSIAERDRRTRISSKLRKLEHLVPNLDKQTNTAEMLDMAVQHIKALQGQVQKLQQDRSNCTCQNK